MKKVLIKGILLSVLSVPFLFTEPAAANQLDSVSKPAIETSFIEIVPFGYPPRH